MNTYSLVATALTGLTLYLGVVRTASEDIGMVLFEWLLLFLFLIYNNRDIYG